MTESLIRDLSALVEDELLSTHPPILKITSADIAMGRAVPVRSFARRRLTSLRLSFAIVMHRMCGWLRRGLIQVS